MDNIKNDSHYINKIKDDLKFVIAHTAGMTREEFDSNDILIDSVMFRLIQISENSDRLTSEYKDNHPGIPWRAMRGLRNRIVHEYGNVDLSIIFQTVINDLPELLHEIEDVL